MPETCAYVLFSGRRYGDAPEPDERCDEEVVPGEEFCEQHLGE